MINAGLSINILMVTRGFQALYPTVPLSYILFYGLDTPDCPWRRIMPVPQNKFEFTQPSQTKLAKACHILSRVRAV